MIKDKEYIKEFNAYLDFWNEVNTEQEKFIKLMNKIRIKQQSKGVKHNQNKLPMSVIKSQFSRAMEAIVKCSQYGHEKYKETDLNWDNFRNVEGGSKTYRDAGERHSLFPVGELDSESGLPHIYHELWNKMAEVELWEAENEREN